MQKNKRVCAYVRAVSLIDGTKKLENQIEAINDYCAKNGLTVSYVYKEISSGIAPVSDRTVGGKMYNDCLAGLWDTIIVSNIDRIGRNVCLVDEFLMIADKMGINIISVAENGNITCFDSNVLQILKRQAKAIAEARK